MHSIPTLLLLILSACASVTAAQSVSINNGVYNLQEARAGELLYQRDCAACHGPDLGGGEIGIALTGEAFRAKWKARALADLFELARTTMPVANPGGLSDTQYIQILAYILYVNNYPQGTTGLAAQRGRMQDIRIIEPVGAGSRQVAIEESTAGPGITLGWLQHRGDLHSTGYSPLDIINRDNAGDLHIAWRWRSDNFGPVPYFNFQVTPLMADGVLYATAGTRRAAVAIDAATGETLWIHRVDEGLRGNAAPRKGPGRGVAWWRDAGSARVFYITPGYQLVALDAASGLPIPDFGNNGIVDLKLGLDQEVDLMNDPIGASSPPLIVNDVIIVGAAFPAGRAPPAKEFISGPVRGYDVRSGKRLWIFHTIPRPGEPGHETWEADSWKYTGNTGAWAPMSADADLGYVYLPVEAPTGDFYGGHRPGDNLFSQSLVCLDVKTGKPVWHFQMVHHGIWDYDPPAPPVLIDINVKGGRIPAVAQVSKQGFTYVFDRRNGEPVWPIEERQVPQSDVPGEKTSPTQPFPTWPLPFDRQGVSDADLNDLTPEIHAESRRLVRGFRMGPLFTPPSLITEDNHGTLMLPAPFGGANWQGAAADPETGILYVSSTSIILNMGLVSDPERSNMRYVGGGRPIKGPFGLPLVKPPWGRITAIDLNTGNHVWMVANADTPQWVREHEKLRGVDLPRTGHNDRVGLLVTRTLLFAGEGAGLYMADGGGTKFRAHDKLTGEIIAEIDLPARQSGVPMTYALNGKQYIVVAVGAQNHPGELIALTVGEDTSAARGPSQ